MKKIYEAPSVEITNVAAVEDILLKSEVIINTEDLWDN